jgi:hypothetical protein
MAAPPAVVISRRSALPASFTTTIPDEGPSPLAVLPFRAVAGASPIAKTEPGVPPDAPVEPSATPRFVLPPAGERGVRMPTKAVAIPFRGKATPFEAKPGEAGAAPGGRAPNANPSTPPPGLPRALPFDPQAPAVRRSEPPAPLATARASSERPLAKSPTLPPTQALPEAPRLTLQQYASLTAELDEAPTTTEATRARYGLDLAGERAETQRWQARFRAAPELASQFGTLVADFRSFLRRSRGGGPR